jgi:hypothetical protein
MYSGIWFPSSGSDLTNGRVTTLRAEDQKVNARAIGVRVNKLT